MASSGLVRRWSGKPQTLLAGEKHPDPRLRQYSNLFTEASCRDYLGRNLVDRAIRECRQLLACVKRQNVHAPAEPVELGRVPS